MFFLSIFNLPTIKRGDTNFIIDCPTVIKKNQKNIYEYTKQISIWFDKIKPDKPGN